MKNPKLVERQRRHPLLPYGSSPFNPSPDSAAVRGDISALLTSTPCSPRGSPLPSRRRCPKLGERLLLPRGDLRGSVVAGKPLNPGLKLSLEMIPAAAVAALSLESSGCSGIEKKGEKREE